MKDNIRDQIALRLRMAREAAGLTQGQVAKKMRLHRPSISEMEAGRRRVSAEELARLAKIYVVSVEWIASEHTESDQANERIMLAARHLTRLKKEDLDRLMNLIRMLR